MDIAEKMHVTLNLAREAMTVGECPIAAMSSFIGEVYYALESPTDGAVRMAEEMNPQSDDFALSLARL